MSKYQHDQNYLIICVHFVLKIIKVKKYSQSGLQLIFVWKLNPYNILLPPYFITFYDQTHI